MAVLSVRAVGLAPILVPLTTVRNRAFHFASACHPKRSACHCRCMRRQRHHESDNQLVGRRSSHSRRSWRGKRDRSWNRTCRHTFQSIQRAAARLDVNDYGSDEIKKTKKIAPRFPGGRKRTELPVPCLLVEFDVSVIVAERNTSSEDGFDLKRVIHDLVVDAIRGAGANVICIKGGSGGQLYNASAEAKAAIQNEFERRRNERSPNGMATNKEEDIPNVLLLVGDDAGAGAAVGADGVLLSKDGVPVVIARRLMGEEGTYLVGRRCEIIQEALDAVKDGADFLSLDGNSFSKSEDGGCNIESKVLQIKKETSIPILVSGISISGADGVLFDCSENDALGLIKQCYEDQETFTSTMQEERVNTDANLVSNETNTLEGTTSRSKITINLIADEREILEQVLDLLGRATPNMDELQLLKDGLDALDSPFLLIVVGEFNSGKSTVINSILGKRYLECGVVPTTNEIAMLRYGDQDASTLDSDGRLIRLLPADILKAITIVDTPGTNVILDRQQRLTEEYVPRADLVMFVLSAERPLSESEVNFMRYIRQWGKKIVFIINKIDLLNDSAELEEVQTFVKKNVDRLLKDNKSKILSLCAKKALATRTDIDTQVQSQLEWKSSGFADLQEYIRQFLGVDFMTGNIEMCMDAEAERLKLRTPLTLGAALLDTCQDELQNDLKALEAEMTRVEFAMGSVKQYQLEAERDLAAIDRKVQKIVDSAVQRACAMVEETLSVSNIQELVFRYTFGEGQQGLGDAFSGTVVGGGFEMLTEAASQSSESSARKQADQEESSKSLLIDLSRRRGVQEALAQQELVECDEKRMAETNQDLEPDIFQHKYKQPSTIIGEFDISAAELLLEQEFRDSASYIVVVTAGAAVFGSISAHFLNSAFDDVLSLIFSGIGGYVGSLSLPLRRYQTQEKVRKVGNAFKQELLKSIAHDAETRIESYKSRADRILKCAQDVLKSEIHDVSSFLSEKEKLTSDVGQLLERVDSL